MKLAAAVSKGDVGAVKKALAAGAEPGENLAQALLNAASGERVRENIEIAKLLVDAGADPGADCFGEAALAVAATLDLELVTAMLDRGADPNARSEDDEDVTPLGKALLHDRVDIAKVLIARGAALSESERADASEETLALLAGTGTETPTQTMAVLRASLSEAFAAQRWKECAETAAKLIELDARRGRIEVMTRERGILAHARLRLGDRDGALVAARENVATYPEEALAHYVLAAILALTGDAPAAIASLRAAVEREDPDIENFAKAARSDEDFDGIRPALEAAFPKAKKKKKKKAPSKK